MPRIKEVVAPLRRRPPMDEHGREFINGFVLVLPYVLQLLLHTGRARAQQLELLLDVVLFCGQIGQQLIVEFR